MPTLEPGMYQMKLKGYASYHTTNKTQKKTVRFSPILCHCLRELLWCVSTLKTFQVFDHSWFVFI